MFSAVMTGGILRQRRNLPKGLLNWQALMFSKSVESGFHRNDSLFGKDTAKKIVFILKTLCAQRPSSLDSARSPGQLEAKFSRTHLPL